MYNQVAFSLPATGAAVAVWWPMAGMALIAVGFAVWRIAYKRRQPSAV